MRASTETPGVVNAWGTWAPSCKASVRAAGAALGILAALSGAVWHVSVIQCCLWQDLEKGHMRVDPVGCLPHVDGLHLGFDVISGMEVEMGGVCSLFLAHSLGQLVTSPGIGFVLTPPAFLVLGFQTELHGPFLRCQLVGSVL